MSLSSLAHRSLGRAGAAVAAAALLVVALTAGPVAADDDVAPSAPSNLTATVVSSTTVTLSWNDPQDSSITGYMILRRNIKNQAAGTFTTLQSKTGNATTTSYTDRAAEPGTKYAYRIKALNDNGASEQSDYINVTTPAVPYAPGNLTATAESSTSVKLSWDDPQDSSITGYMILRRDIKNQAAGTFTTIQSDTGTAATTSYADSAADPDTKYAYRIKARNANGASEQSNYVNVTTPAQTDDDNPPNTGTVTPVDPGGGDEPAIAPQQVEATELPASPTNLTASSTGPFSVTLNWDAPSDPTVTGYRIYRRSIRTRHVEDYLVIVEDTGSVATSYVDTPPWSNASYFYKVKALNAVGVSAALPGDHPSPNWERVKTLPETPESPELDDVHVTTMTVGHTSRPQSGSTYDLYGYSSLIRFWGSLGSAGFTYDGADYEISGLNYISAQGAEPEPYLLLLVSRGGDLVRLPDRLWLIVGDERYPVRNSWREATEGHYWTIDDPGWESGDMVDVRIGEPSADRHGPELETFEPSARSAGNGDRTESVDDDR